MPSDDFHFTVVRPTPSVLDRQDELLRSYTEAYANYQKNCKRALWWRIGICTGLAVVCALFVWCQIG